jgi:hypothetical protein
MPKGVYSRTTRNTGWCQVDGCEKPSGNRANICEMHYYRNRRTGQLDRAPYRVDAPSYRAAHTRVAQARGKASDHQCWDCDKRGAHWSFAWRRVQAPWLWEAVNGTMLAYTGNAAAYDPRCHRCARRYDGDFARQGWRSGLQLPLPHHATGASHPMSAWIFELP